MNKAKQKPDPIRRTAPKTLGNVFPAELMRYCGIEEGVSALEWTAKNRKTIEIKVGKLVFK